MNTKTNPVYDLGDNNTAAADDLYTLASQEPAADEGVCFFQSMLLCFFLAICVLLKKKNSSYPNCDSA